MTKARPTVVFIAGNGRCGSTLLDRMLGETACCLSTGELSQIWRRGVRDNALCACGKSFHECAFWTSVGDVAFGGWNNLDAAAVVKLQRSVDRSRYVPWMMAQRLRPGYRRRLQTYGDAMAALYRALSEVSGRRVIVDSSKYPHTALFLHASDRVDLHVVHLVRDSRGVAFSWQKSVRKPDARPDDEYMNRYSPATSAVKYLLTNALLEMLPLIGHRTLRLRYEDLVARPETELRRVLDILHASDADTALVTDGAINLTENHSVGGNPMRFRQGRTHVRADEAWRTQLESGARMIVTSLTWPLLRRYGYLSHG